MRMMLSLVIVAALAAGCDQKASTPAGAAPAAEVDPVAAAKQLIASGALVLDVREQDEWDEGHLPQAKLFPVGTVAERLAEIETAAGGKDRPVVVYCKSGGRAGKAKQVLEAAGFTHVVNGGGYRGLVR
ncbi:MAG: rhodanese-like domain-containing protein [Kofleriaceae bacterium]